MKKSIFSITTLLAFGLFALSPIYALTTELTSQNETEKVFTIISSAPQESSAMKLRVSVVGGTIKSVENADSSNLAFMPVCQNGSTTDGQDICIDVAVIGGTFQENHEILKVTVETNDTQEVLFSPGDDHSYLTINSELVRENGEVIQTFPTQAQVEEPATVDDQAMTNDTNYLPFVLLLGILVVLVGAFLAIIFFSDKDSTK